MSHTEQYIYDKNNWLIGHSPITIKPTGKFPAIAYHQWNTFEDLMSFVHDEDSTAIPGMVVAVVNDDEYVNGIYVIDSVGEEGTVHRMVNTVEFQKYIDYVRDNIQTYVAGKDIEDWFKTEQIGDIEAGLSKYDEKIFGQKVNHMLDMLLYPTLQPIIKEPSITLNYEGEKCFIIGTQIPDEIYFEHSYDKGSAYTSTYTNPEYTGDVTESWEFNSPSNEHSYNFNQAMDEEGEFVITYAVNFGDGPELKDNKGFPSTVESFRETTLTKDVKLHVVKPIYVNDGLFIGNVEQKLVDYLTEEPVKINVDIVSETDENKFEIHVPSGFGIEVKQYNTISDTYNIPVDMVFVEETTVHDSVFGKYDVYVRTTDNTDIQGSSKYQITITRQ